MLLLIWFIFRMFTEDLGTRSMTAVFFIFGLAAYLAADMYWLAHLIVKEGMTPDFSTVEIGIAGLFLLWGAAVSAYRRDDYHSGYTSAYAVSALPVALTVIFVMAITAFWIAWTGGWVKDIITGIAMGYLSCVLSNRLHISKMFSKKEWIHAGVYCGFLLGFEAGTLLTHGVSLMILHILRYICWFGGSLFLGCKIRDKLLREKNPEQGLYLSFAGFVWNVYILYLSTGILYQIANVLVTLSIIPMYLTVRKEVCR